MEAPDGLWVVVAESRSTGEKRQMSPGEGYEKAWPLADVLNRQGTVWFYCIRPLDKMQGILPAEG